jgi:ABC-type Fe3+-hydroxamate transport system substrate-binding protein
MKNTILLLLLLLCALLSACGQDKDSETKPEVATPPTPEVTAPSIEEPEQIAVPSPSTTQEISVGTEDEAAAREAAETYYADTVFAGRIADMVRILDPDRYSDAVSDDNKTALTLAFEVILTDNGTPPRTIVLAEKTDGTWSVINEGY